ncbi:MAG: hypothetical protein GX113_00230 [Actinobacteria bacterium]|nr:hypothetical protein [Actinomycetota bacterium]
MLTLDFRGHGGSEVEFKGLSVEEAMLGVMFPTRFIAAEGDTGADSARRPQELSEGSGELYLVPGDDHGTDLLNGEAADQVWSLLVDFLDDHLDPTQP